MMPLSKDLLDVVMLNLQRTVAPHVTGDDGRMTLMLVNYVLGFLYVEEHDRPAWQAQRFAAVEPLLQEFRQRLASAGVDTPSASATGDARVAIDQALREPSHADATSRALQLALRAGAADDAQWARRFVQAELAHVEQLADAVNGWAYGQAVEALPEAGQRQLTADLVSAYLREKLPDYPAIAATRVVEIGGGFSKKTYRLDVAGGPPDWEQLVIRQDAIGGPVPASCLDEVEVLRLARRHGLRVSPLHWVEKSAEPLDAPFLFGRRMAGVCSLDAWKQPGPDGRLPGEHLAAQVALLHRIPLGELPGFDASIAPAQVLWNYVDGFERRWLRDRVIFDPLIQLGFDWLKRKLPRDVEQLAIVHADISERNMLVDQGELTALLDWELWHVGDPMYDLAYLKPFIEQSLPWPRFVELYQAAGGPAVSMVNEDYWYIFSKIRDSAMLSSGLRTFVDGRNRNLKTIAPVLGWYRPQLRLAMRRLLPLL